MINNNENWEILVAMFAALLFLFILIALVMNVWMPFKENRDTIKMEMNRSEGREYKYWKRELRRLYLCHIPIVRWFFRKKY